MCVCVRLMIGTCPLVPSLPCLHRTVPNGFIFVLLLHFSMSIFKLSSFNWTDYFVVLLFFCACNSAEGNMCVHWLIIYLCCLFYVSHSHSLFFSSSPCTDLLSVNPSSVELTSAFSSNNSRSSSVAATGTGTGNSSSSTSTTVNPYDALNSSFGNHGLKDSQQNALSPLNRSLMDDSVSFTKSWSPFFVSFLNPNFYRCRYLRSFTIQFGPCLYGHWRRGDWSNFWWC